jgi:hypothetical protein
MKMSLYLLARRQSAVCKFLTRATHSWWNDFGSGAAWK